MKINPKTLYLQIEHTHNLTWAEQDVLLLIHSYYTEIIHELKMNLMFSIPFHDDILKNK